MLSTTWQASTKVASLPHNLLPYCTGQLTTISHSLSGGILSSHHTSDVQYSVYRPVYIPQIMYIMTNIIQPIHSTVVAPVLTHLYIYIY